MATHSDEQSTQQENIVEYTSQKNCGQGQQCGEGQNKAKEEQAATKTQGIARQWQAAKKVARLKSQEDGQSENNTTANANKSQIILSPGSRLKMNTVSCKICGLQMLKSGYPLHYDKCQAKKKRFESMKIPTSKDNLSTIREFAAMHQLNVNTRLGADRTKLNIILDIKQALSVPLTFEEKWELKRSQEVKAPVQIIISKEAGADMKNTKKDKADSATIDEAQPVGISENVPSESNAQVQQEQSYKELEWEHMYAEYRKQRDSEDHNHQHASDLPNEQAEKKRLQRMRKEAAVEYGKEKNMKRLATQQKKLKGMFPPIKPPTRSHGKFKRKLKRPQSHGSYDSAKKLPVVCPQKPKRRATLDCPPQRPGRRLHCKEEENTDQISLPKQHAKLVEDPEATFRPQIFSELFKSTRVRPAEPYHERLYYRAMSAQEREERAAKIRKEMERECTFQPRLLSRNGSQYSQCSEPGGSDEKAAYERLYEQGLALLQQAKLKEGSADLSQCTFQPNIGESRRLSSQESVGGEKVWERLAQDKREIIHQREEAKLREEQKLCMSPSMTRSSNSKSTQSMVQEKVWDRLAYDKREIIHQREKAKLREEQKLCMSPSLTRSFNSNSASMGQGKVWDRLANDKREIIHQREEIKLKEELEACTFSPKMSRSSSGKVKTLHRLHSGSSGYRSRGSTSDSYMAPTKASNLKVSTEQERNPFELRNNAPVSPPVTGHRSTRQGRYSTPKSRNTLRTPSKKSASRRPNSRKTSRTPSPRNPKSRNASRLKSNVTQNMASSHKGLTDVQILQIERVDKDCKIEGALKKLTDFAINEDQSFKPTLSKGPRVYVYNTLQDSTHERSSDILSDDNSHKQQKSADWSTNLTSFLTSKKRANSASSGMNIITALLTPKSEKQRKRPQT